jgi:hypothetical protein
MDFDFRSTMQKYMDRNQEGKSYLIGPSGVGACYRQQAYRYFGTPESDFRPKDKADLGTLLHLGWSAMLKAMFDPEERRGDVRIEVPGLPRAGESDDVDFVNRIVTDLKSANDRAWQAAINRGGPYENYWDQDEVYAYGLWLKYGGDWTLRIVLFNTEKGGEVEFTRAADPERGKRLAEIMAARHSALATAVIMGGKPEDFPREGNGPTRGFPCDWCEYVTECWPDWEGDLSPQAQTIVDDEGTVEAYAEQYLTASAAESAAKKAKYDAAAFLSGIRGTFGGFTVTRTRDGEGSDEPDVDAMVTLLGDAGIPVPTSFKPGRRGYVKVGRVKPPKASPSR